MMTSNEDIDGKGYVHWKTWHETYAGLIDPMYMGQVTLESCIEMAHRWPENLLVAKDGEKVIGFAGYGESEEAGCGEVLALYVLKEYHDQKVGYALMNAAIKKLEGYDTIIVWVLKGNEKAIHFYERYGFSFDGSQKEIKLGTPVTELKMVWRANH